MKKTYLFILAIFCALTSRAFTYDLNEVKADIKDKEKIGVGDATCYGDMN